MDEIYDLELDDNSILAQQPPKILTLLKPHQRACLNKAINMEINGIVKYKISEKNPLNINYRNTEIIIPNNIIDVSTNCWYYRRYCRLWKNINSSFYSSTKSSKKYTY